MNNYNLQKIKPEAVLAIFEANAKKRKINPKTSIFIINGLEVEKGTIFTGTNNSYTVGEIIERRPSNVSTHEYLTFMSTT